jgi:hypothetical protein
MVVLFSALSLKSACFGEDPTAIPFPNHAEPQHKHNLVQLKLQCLKLQISYNPCEIQNSYTGTLNLDETNLMPPYSTAPYRTTYLIPVLQSEKCTAKADKTDSKEQYNIIYCKA